MECVALYRGGRIDQIKLSLLERMCAHPALPALGIWIFFAALSVSTRFWPGLAIGGVIAVICWASLHLSRKQLPELRDVVYGPKPPPS